MEAGFTVPTDAYLAVDDDGFVNIIKPKFIIKVIPDTSEFVSVD